MTKELKTDKKKVSFAQTLHALVAATDQEDAGSFWQAHTRGGRKTEYDLTAEQILGFNYRLYRVFCANNWTDGMLLRQ